MNRLEDDALRGRAAVHAALGEPARLAIAELLVVSDRSPRELAEILGLPSNLLAHHLDVLEAANLISRSASAGDSRRKYVRLRHLVAGPVLEVQPWSPGPVLFLCTHNSARSQLAAAIWRSRTGCPALSAGTRPALRVHRGAVAAARRRGLSLDGAVPSMVGEIPVGVQVVTVCDLVHEELEIEPDWWHWSIPDPVAVGDAAAFDAAADELDARIRAIGAPSERKVEG